MQAAAATLTTVNSDELNDTKWFPGKNFLKAAKVVESVVAAVPAGDALAAGSIPIGGGELTVRV